MSKPLPKPSIFRRAFFAIWGMATLILFATVALLVVEMWQRGQDPLTIVSETQLPSKTEVRTTDSEADYRRVALYFTNEDGHNLAAERRRILWTNSTAENCKRALQELMEGPRENEDLLSIVPENTELLAAFLLDGRLVVNFTNELRAGAQKSATAEGLMIYGIVNTVTQADLVGEDGLRVSSVQFLVEGEMLGGNFPAHFDLSEPVIPDSQWTASIAPAIPDNA